MGAANHDHFTDALRDFRMLDQRQGQVDLRLQRCDRHAFRIGPVGSLAHHARIARRVIQLNIAGDRGEPPRIKLVALR